MSTLTCLIVSVLWLSFHDKLETSGTKQWESWSSFYRPPGKFWKLFLSSFEGKFIMRKITLQIKFEIFLYHPELFFIQTWQQILREMFFFKLKFRVKTIPDNFLRKDDFSSQENAKSPSNCFYCFWQFSDKMFWQICKVDCKAELSVLSRHIYSKTRIPHQLKSIFRVSFFIHENHDIFLRHLTKIPTNASVAPRNLLHDWRIYCFPWIETEKCKSRIVGSDNSFLLQL